MLEAQSLAILITVANNYLKYWKRNNLYIDRNISFLLDRGIGAEITLHEKRAR